VTEIRDEERNAEIWRAYCSGLSQVDVATRFNLSQSRVSQIILEVKAAIPPDDLTDWRLRAFETLKVLHADMVATATADPPPAFHAGEVLKDDNGNVVRDLTTRMHAIDRVVKLQERAGRSMGTDAPAKAQVTGQVRYVIDGVEPEALT
jgi:hypothetical protein